MNTQPLKTPLEWFKERKELLLKAYDQVLKRGLLPVGDLDEVKVKEKCENLVSERFFLAVCGQIKSGKSLLLNALVFGSPVLPTKDTIMTAKNTLIEYGDTNTIEVVYYSEKEWDLLVQELQKDEQTWALFSSEIKKAANKGVLKDEYVRPHGRVDTISGVERLGEFVTPVDEGGRFSPFVKMVKVKYDHPWLREVTVADTPGVNDPFRFREDITKSWIHNAGAVLYVTYAGQAMSKPDFEFLDEYLQGIAPYYRVIAVNKIDIVDNLQEVKTWVRRLAESKDYRLRNIFGDPDSIVYVCALGGLIQSMIAKGLPLSQELSEWQERLEEGGYLDPRSHHIEDLRNLVEKRLIKNKGEALLEDHSHFLDSLFERKKRLLIEQINGLKASWSLLGQTREERAQEREIVDRQIISLNDYLNDFSRNMDRVIDAKFLQLARQQTKFRESVIGRLKQELDLAAHKGISHLKRMGTWIISNATREPLHQLIEGIRSILEDLDLHFRDLITELKGRLDASSAGSSLNISCYIDLTAFELQEFMEKELREKGLRDRIEEGVSEATWWWQRLFNTEKGKQAAKDVVLSEAEQALDKGLGDIFNQFKHRIKEEAGRVRRHIQERLNRVLENRRREIDEIDRGMVDIDAELNELEQKLSELNNALEQVEASHFEIKAVLETIG